MSPHFRRIGITAREDIPGKDAMLQELIAVIRSAGADVCLDPLSCAIPSLPACEKLKELRSLDLIIVIGGDGTILRTVRQMKDFSIPLLTINRGTLGFLTECNASEIATIIPVLLEDGGTIEERQMLSCAVVREGKEVLRGRTLNEVVIHQGAIARLINLAVRVGSEPLATFRSDGVIIATPTGSTAYSLAAGGPIVHPLLSAIIITPINAHAFSQKPIVVPSDEAVSVDILPRERLHDDVEVSLTLDGQIHHVLACGDTVTVAKAPECVRFLKRRRDSFFGTLQQKLRWGE